MMKDSVTRTASDALLAKWSALDAGYRPAGENSDSYKSLLQQMTAAALQREGIRQKRQSPLVNAGYAARIACMTYAVESFMSYHKTAATTTCSQLQVVLLGCGLDVLGLWAFTQSPDEIKLFEVDTPEIVKVKKDLLESMQWLQVSSTENDNEMLSVEGLLNLQADFSGEHHCKTPNYTIASCDLKDVASVDRALAGVNRRVPTLFLTELVLPYLGRQGTDDLLNSCASDLCVAPGSAFAAYEALDASSNGGLVTRSVVDGYRDQYAINFRDKLQRGIINEGDTSLEDIFHPLGDCPAAVKKRLSGAGFSWAQASLAGTVTACIFENDKKKQGGRSFQPCEPFDEHAALALHLHSYVYTCTFPEQTDVDLIRSMCPWSSVSSFDTLSKIIQVENGSDVCIRPIEASDQQLVQNLFLDTYKELSEQFSAVRKMVKTACNTDLKFSAQDSLSSIAVKYQTWGGIFLVAIDESHAPITEHPDTPSSSCRVIGCLGIRLCEASEGAVRGGPETTFEIHRFAVDAASRGRGIGKALLRFAEENFIQKDLYRNEAYRLVATTPALLEQANNTYKSSGFTLQKQETLGEMTINTYVKESNSK